MYTIYACESIYIYAYTHITPVSNALSARKSNVIILYTTDVATRWFYVWNVPMILLMTRKRDDKNT